MKRIFLAGTAALLLALVGTGSASAEYKAEHRGGTMRLVAHGRVPRERLTDWRNVQDCCQPQHEIE